MTEQLQEENPLDRKDLKILSYRQKVSEQEDAIADLRVELTIVSSQLQEALDQLAKHNEPADAKEDDAPKNKD